MGLDPWGTPLVTGSQIDFAPLITTIWAWPFSWAIHEQPYAHKKLSFRTSKRGLLQHTVQLRETADSTIFYAMTGGKERIQINTLFWYGMNGGKKPFILAY